MWKTTNFCFLAIIFFSWFSKFFNLHFYNFLHQISWEKKFSFHINRTRGFRFDKKAFKYPQFYLLKNAWTFSFVKGFVLMSQYSYDHLRFYVSKIVPWMIWNVSTSFKLRLIVFQGYSFTRNDSINNVINYFMKSVANFSNPNFKKNTVKIFFETKQGVSNYIKILGFSIFTKKKNKVKKIFVQTSRDEFSWTLKQLLREFN